MSQWYTTEYTTMLKIVGVKEGRRKKQWYLTNLNLGDMNIILYNSHLYRYIFLTCHIHLFWICQLHHNPCPNEIFIFRRSRTILEKMKTIPPRYTLKISLNNVNCFVSCLCYQWAPTNRKNGHFRDKRSHPFIYSPGNIFQYNFWLRTGHTYLCRKLQ